MTTRGQRAFGVTAFLLGMLCAPMRPAMTVQAEQPCAAPVEGAAPQETTPDTAPEAAPDAEPAAETAAETAAPEPTLPTTPELPTVRFSEAFPDPDGTDADAEFIEIENFGPNASGAGAYIANASGKSFVLAADIAPHGFASYAYAVTKLSLVNGGMTLTLRSADGSTLDTLTYGTAKAGKTYARRADGAWEWTTTATPGAANAFDASTPAPTTEPAATPAAAEPASTPAPVASAASPEPAPAAAPAQTTAEPAASVPSVEISEFIPDPAGTDDAEWIELRNPGAAAAVLDGLLLDDADGGSAPFNLKGLTIPPHGLLLVPKSLSKLSLNNDADAVRLLAAGGAVRATITYANPPEGKSYAAYGGSWYWSATPTPGAENGPPPASAAATLEEGSAPTGDTPDGGEGGAAPGSLNAPIPTEIENLDAADDDFIEVRATVTLVPGIIGKRLFMVGSAGGGRGVVVRAYGTKPLPALQPGDAVRLVGKAAIAAGRPQLSVNGDGVTRVGGGTLTFAERDASDVTEEDIGAALAVRGAVVRKGASSLVLTDADAGKEITVRFVSALTEPPAKGQILVARGVLRVRSDAFELMAGGQEDIAVQQEIGPAETAPSAKPATDGEPAAATTRTRTAAGAGVPRGAALAACALIAAGVGIAAYRRRRSVSDGIDDLPALDTSS